MQNECGRVCRSQTRIGSLDISSFILQSRGILYCTKAEPAGEKISRRMLSPGPETWFREEYPPVRNRGPPVLFSNEQRGRRVKRCHVYLETPKGWHGVSQHRYADQYRSMLLEVFCYGCLISTGYQIWTPSIIFAHPSHLLYTPRNIDRSTRRPCLALGRVHDLTKSAACAISRTSISRFS